MPLSSEDRAILRESIPRWREATNQLRFPAHRHGLRERTSFGLALDLAQVKCSKWDHNYWVDHNGLGKQQSHRSAE